MNRLYPSSGDPSSAEGRFGAPCEAAARRTSPTDDAAPTPPATASGSEAIPVPHPFPKRRSLLDHLTPLMSQPETEWQVIADETSTASDVFWRYGAVLSAIGPVASLVERLLFGRFEPSQEPIAVAVLNAALAYGLFGLLGSLVLSFATFGLPRAFGSKPHFSTAMKVSVYGQTPMYLAGAVLVAPPSSPSFMWVLGLTTLYALCSNILLVRAGSRILMDVPTPKSLLFAVLLTVTNVAIVGVGAILMLPVLVMETTG